MDTLPDQESPQWPTWPFIAGLILTSLTGVCWVFVRLYDRLFPDLEWPDEWHIPDIAFSIASYGLWLGVPLLAVGSLLLLLHFFCGTDAS